MTTKKSLTSKKSKRLGTKLKNRIKKRKSDHIRKMRKEARKLSALGIHRGPKATNRLHVPNMYPYKKRLIQSIENQKLTDKRKKILEKMSLKTKADTNLSVIKEDPVRREKDFLKNQKTKKKTFKNKKYYIKELKEVVENSDIILEVLDARDPLGCRCHEIEAEAQGMGARGKKIIFVLNKIDLVPMPIVLAWKAHLEREFATVLFKANTQGQNRRLGSNKLYQNSLHKNPELAHRIINTSKGVGSEKLMELIKNYSKNEGIKTSVTVGVIGFPNVGKSSVINSLKKQRSAGVSGNAGFTKSLQVIDIDSKVKIIDSPGVILTNEDEVTLILRNQLNASEVKDPIAPIDKILQRTNKEKMLMLYQIADFTNPTQFLFNVAQVRGKFKKHGIVDLEASARLVIEDWNSGKMSHYVPPPGFDPTVMIDYNSDMEEEIDVMDDFIPKIGNGKTMTEHDLADMENAMEIEK